MADPFIATALLVAGFCWAALYVLAMSNHPTGGTDFSIAAIVPGLAAMAVGAVWWVALIAGWLF